MVQEILSSMDSDEVNSINDTVEANDVAVCIRRAFFDLVEPLGLTEHQDVFQLNASGDGTKPTLMTRPDNVNQLYWIKYNKVVAGQTDPDFQEIEYVEPFEFINRMHGLKVSDLAVDSFVHTFSGDNITLLYRNNKAPSWWTSWDDYSIVFDSYDKNVDTTLQRSKTLCGGLKAVPFTLTDNFIPDLDDAQFALLLNEAKALAWAEKKQVTHSKAEKTAKRHLVHALRKKTALPGNYPDIYRLPNYGRK